MQIEICAPREAFSTLYTNEFANSTVSVHTMLLELLRGSVNAVTVGAMMQRKVGEYSVLLTKIRWNLMQLLRW